MTDPHVLGRLLAVHMKYIACKQERVRGWGALRLKEEK